MFLKDSTDDGKQLSITHFKKARAIYNLFGEKDGAKNMEDKIAIIDERKRTTNNGSVHKGLS